MTAPADLVLTGAEVHTLTEPDRTHEGVAVRDGEVVRVGADYEVGFLDGVETTALDLGGRVVLPGFVDAHTHMRIVGWRERNADLGGAGGPGECVARLRDHGAGGEGWLLGFGFDESEWTVGAGELRAGDLDRASDERPVAAFREDLHGAVLNSVALDRLRDAMPNGDVETEGGEPTGAVVEGALDPVFEAISPGRAGTRELLRAAQHRAHRVGVTGVHDMVRRARTPAAYRDLARAGDLALRVRLNYWTDHLDAAVEVGLHTNHGGPLVETGAIKTYSDGSIGSHTARLQEPYADAEGRGRWVVDPDDLRDVVARADGEGCQVAVHAIGDAAVDATLDALAATDDPGGARHRIEHAELATDEQIERAADLGVVASVQPNFHRWAGEGGLYDRRLGDRRERTNRLAAWRDADVPLAFGSDCMPLDPLVGVHYAVDPPVGEGLSVTEALRAYTRGSAAAGFAEDRLGTVEYGTAADLVAVEPSPWAVDDRREVEVVLTVVGGEVVYDAR